MKKDDLKRLSLDDVLAGLEENGCVIGLVDPEEYHGWKKQIPNCVSKSMLHEFAQNALLFHMNETEGRKVERSGFRMGSAVDSCVLTPELFSVRYFCEAKKIALTKEGKPAMNGRQDPEQKARWVERFAAGDILLDEKEFSTVLQVAGNVRDAWSKLGLQVGENALSQVAMFVRLEEVGGAELAVPLVVCGMLDLMPLEGELLWDLKTTSRGVQEFSLNAQIADYGYGIQAALYADLFEVCTGQARGFAFMFAETQAPWQCRAVLMPAEGEVAIGYRAMYERMLAEYAICLHTGNWGEAVLPAMVYAPPRYEAAKLAAEVL